MFSGADPAETGFPETRFSSYCRAVIESSILATVIVLPVFFNASSNRTFEPDKIIFLRSLVLVMMAVVAMLCMETLHRSGKSAPLSLMRCFVSMMGIPVMPSVFFLAAISTGATLFSVAPAISLAGTYHRSQGLYTTLCCLALFAVCVTVIRNRFQIERIVSMMIVSSLPVGLYAVMQAQGIDPLVWQENFGSRISATMGNPIFLSAYSGMVMPLVLGRLVQTWGFIRGQKAISFRQVIRAGGYGFILLLHALVMIFSQSRGPLLGVIAGFFFLSIMAAFLLQRRSVTLGLLSSAGLVMAVFFMLNSAGGPLESLRTSPYLSRFSKVADVGHQTSRVRICIWEGASQLMLPHDPIRFPDGSGDRLNTLRPLIGYGPETLQLVYDRFFPPELSRIESINAAPDRAHNEPWDVLVTTGIIGLAAYLAVYLSLFYYACKWLGAIPTQHHKKRFFVLVSGAAGVFVSVFIGYLGLAFAGVALTLGISLGVLLYLLTLVLSDIRRFHRLKTQENRSPDLIVLMLATGMITHFIETGFGIAVCSTRVYFWLYAGMMVAAQRCRRRPDPPGKDCRTPMSTAVSNGLFVSILLCASGYGFLSSSMGSSMESDPSGGFFMEHGAAFLLAVSGFVCCFLLSAEQKTGELKKNTIVTVGTALVPAMFFFLIYSHPLSVQGVLAAGYETGDLLNRQIRLYGARIDMFYLIVFGLIALAAAVLAGRLTGIFCRRPGVTLPFSLVAFALAVLGVATVLLPILHADIAFKAGETLMQAKPCRWKQAKPLLEQALSTAPDQDCYLQALGRHFLAAAFREGIPVERENLLSRAAVLFHEAQAKNPLCTDHTADLAELFKCRAMLLADHKEEDALISENYFKVAAAMRPYHVNTLNEWANLYLEVLNRVEKSMEILGVSLALDPDNEAAHAMLADCCQAKARQQENSVKRDTWLRKALRYYRDLFSLMEKQAPECSRKGYPYLLKKGAIEHELAMVEEAIITYRTSLDRCPPHHFWRIAGTISRLYVQGRDYDNALRFAMLALEKAPADQHEAGGRMIRHIIGLKSEAAQKGLPRP